MKILAVGYYDDFARFFLAIKRELKGNNKPVEFRYFSLYLSGFLYFLLRLQSVVYLPLVVHLSVLRHKKTYQKDAETGFFHGINLEEIIRYHFLLNKNDREKLLLQAVGYIRYYERCLATYSPDIVLLSGDSRMSVQILDTLAKQKGIKTYYFEQGPFGTTTWDTMGVNANASIRYLKDFSVVTDAGKRVISFLQRNRRTVYKRNPIYRGSDYIYQAVSDRLGLLPADIKMEKKEQQTRADYSAISVNREQRREKTILLVLQVPYDVNMVFHSPLYDNHADIVKDVFNGLPEGYHLIVREHPLYKGRYENALYAFMKDNQIEMDGLGLAESMQNANVVVVNNSTVGIEAIAINKPTVILGDCYYDSANIALKLTQRERLPLLLQQATGYQVDKNKAMQFLHYFLFEFLVDGHFRDKVLIAPEKIALKVKNND